ncbi:NAD(P)/FAD-dependent oxidoreductase [Clostridium sp.]|uniref:NAD(P)/FAD-dependent oxidoreductase n=1 Tax=Clostridium sp. TaxID=1506 RepID=UPI002FCA7F22
MDKIVIVGSGVAALTAAESIKIKNPKMPVIVIGQEEYLPYNRMRLSKALSDGLSVDSILLKGQDFYTDNGIGFIKGCKVTAINTVEKIVETSLGLKIDYSKLILANGSSPFIPSIENVNINGVFSIREFNDVVKIKDYIKENNVKDVAVIGGGLLGIEAAYSLASSGQGFNVNIIQNSAAVLSRQVDVEGGNLLENIMGENSIKVHKNADTKKILGSSNVQGIEIADGRVIDAQMVIISAGVRANLSIAKDASIETGRGVKVNEFMETSVADVYAAGDVAEFNGKTPGLWPIATEQGRIAGLNAVGEKTAYKPIIPSSMLMVMGINLFSVGDISSEGLTAIKYEEGKYTKLFFNNGVLVGAVLIDNPAKSFAIKAAIDGKRDFSKEISEGSDIYQAL